MSRLSGISREDAARLAYGILWHTVVDRYTPTGRMISDARTALANSLSHEEKGQGIADAKAWFREQPLPNTKDTHND